MSIARPTRPLGVDARPVACSLELGPLTYLLGLGFLRPAEKDRLAAGHGELPEIVRPPDGAWGYHGVQSRDVRSVTFAKKLRPPDAYAPLVNLGNSRET